MTSHIDDYNDHSIETNTYTGTGADLDIKGLGLQPDLVWMKPRSATNAHTLVDAVRGVTKRIWTNNSNAEAAEAESLKTFNSDGFTLGNHSTINTSGVTHVAWNWKETATAGFDIVSYTGTGSAQTISHSLGVAPEMAFFKKRSEAFNWLVYTKLIDGSLDYLVLNTTAAKSDSGWSTLINSSSQLAMEGDSDGLNDNGETYIAYLFASIPNYSAFGKYTGNGNAAGPFVYTGLSVKYLLQKRADSSSNWQLMDIVRDDAHDGPGNPIKRRLKAEGNGAEFDGVSTDTQFDFLSNGFNVRDTDLGINASGGTYIYAAFAEHPFKTARAK